MVFVLLPWTSTEALDRNHKESVRRPSTTSSVISCVIDVLVSLCMRGIVILAPVISGSTSSLMGGNEFKLRVFIFSCFFSSFKHWAYEFDRECC